MRKSGLCSNDLLKVYNTVIRPAIEYSAVVYHSLISNDMAEKLEGMQRQAMRIIYGWDGNIRDKMENKGIESLQDRREEMVLKFALKNEKNQKYGQKWFKKSEETNREARSTTRKKYQEQFCRTDRLKNNPINYMTKKLNEHYSK